jgi:hypothetical protein
MATVATAGAPPPSVEKTLDASSGSDDPGDPSGAEPGVPLSSDGEPASCAELTAGWAELLLPHAATDTTDANNANARDEVFMRYAFFMAKE